MKDTSVPATSDRSRSLIVARRKDQGFVLEFGGVLVRVSVAKAVKNNRVELRVQAPLGVLIERDEIRKVQGEFT